MEKNSFIWLAAAVAIGLGIIYFMRSGPLPGYEPVNVTVPELTAEAQAGRTIFEANCKKCHGKNAGGSRKGPPLVHKIYEPSHHGDIAFQMAVKNGVLSHHWPFGKMPPVPGVSEEQVTSIISYVRELQRANGIR